MQWQKAFLIKKNYHTQTLEQQGFAQTQFLGCPWPCRQQKTPPRGGVFA
jgi:hypothetical protein